MDGYLFVYWFWCYDSKQKENRRIHMSQSRAKQSLLLSGIFVGKSYHEGLARLSTQTFDSLRNGKLDWFQYNTCKKFVFVTITTLNF